MVHINDLIQRKNWFKQNKIIYLDSACSALKFRFALKEQKSMMERYGSCGGERAIHILASKTEEFYNKAREIISKLINASYEEIVFTSGTTESFNILANSFKFNRNDEMIISGLEHNSVFLPFYKVSKKNNIKLKIIPLKDYNPDFEEFKKLITSKTRILCISKASNFFGGVVETEKIINHAKKNNIKVFMDLAQYAPTHKVNVKELNIDAAAFSGHKIGAPYGTGVLYLKKELYKHLDSSKVGGGTIKELIFKDGDIKVDFLQGYKSFEAGIQNYAGQFAMALTYQKLNEIGFDNIRKHISDLIRYTVKELSQIKEIEIVGKNLEKGSIVSFRFKDTRISYPDFALYLSSLKKPIAIRYGRLCADLACKYSNIENVIRLSFFIYNDKSDADAFVKALKDYLILIRK
ncbi:MAG: aminotransferase class V-fold PLP-dependent enzyme [Elusimicrobiota bacterium]